MRARAAAIVLSISGFACRDPDAAGTAATADGRTGPIEPPPPLVSYVESQQPGEDE
jgi:hypothetical protein